MLALLFIGTVAVCQPCQRCTRGVGVERDVDARRFAEHIGDVDVFESMKRRLPLLFEREMLDVVLEHVVLHLERGELLDQAGVAGGIEDDVADAEERKARRGGQKQCRAAPMIHLRRLLSVNFIEASCG